MNADAFDYVCLFSSCRPTLGEEHKPVFCNSSWPFDESDVKVQCDLMLICCHLLLLISRKLLLCPHSSDLEGSRGKMG